MRIAVVFMLAALGACPAPSQQQTAAAPRVERMPAALSVARSPGVHPGGRGASCRANECAESLTCHRGLALPGGYCASTCGIGHTACDGACVESRDGELCVQRCTHDGDCRVDEGYACDAQSHACVVPGFAVPRAKQCAQKPALRDPAFGDSDILSTPSIPGVSQRAPSMIAVGDRYVALYTTSSGDTDSLAVARSEQPGALVLDLPFAPPGSDGRLARDRTGALHAVWTDIDGIFLASSLDQGRTWGTPIAVHDPGDCVGDTRPCLERPLLVVGKPGLLHLFYGGGELGLRVRTSRDGGRSFTTGPLVLAGTSAAASASADGKLHVAAMTGSALGGYGSAMQRIEYAASSDSGTTFTTPVTISGTDEVLPFFFGRPAIAVDTQRRWIYIAYVRGGRDAAWDIVLAASRDAGVTWSRTKLVGDGCALHLVPSLALDPTTGRLHVTYYDSEVAAGRYVHASCGPGVTKCAIHGAINSLPFARLSLARHSSTWLGDVQSLVFDETRRILHASWAQTVDENGAPITRIFHAQATLIK